MRHAAFLAVCLFLAGCDSLDGVPPGAGRLVTSDAELTVAAAPWGMGQPDAYRLRYEVVCECFGGATVTVRGGRVVAAEGPGATDPITVDRLFAMARQALAGGTGEVRLSEREPRLPVYINHDPEGQPVDGGYVLTVTGFEVD